MYSKLSVLIILLLFVYIYCDTPVPFITILIGTLLTAYSFLPFLFHFVPFMGSNTLIQLQSHVSDHRRDASCQQ